MSIIIAKQTLPPVKKYCRSNEFISKLKGVAYNPHEFAKRYSVNVEIVYRIASLYRGRGLPIPPLDGEPSRPTRAKRENTIDAMAFLLD